MTELKQHTHDDRVLFARQICEKILQAYDDDVIAVYIIGSTAKKLDRPYSDLEMIAIVNAEAKAPPMKYYVLNGLVVQIEYRTESHALAEARLVTREWPVARDESINRIVLFDRNRFFSRLDKAAAEAENPDLNEAAGFGMVGLFEKFAVILNSLVEKDEAYVRTACVGLAIDAAKVVLLLNRKYVLTSSWFWKEARACPVKPENFWTCIEKLAGFKPVSAEELKAAAADLVDGVLKIVESRGGILVESPSIIV